MSAITLKIINRQNTNEVDNYLKNFSRKPAAAPLYAGENGGADVAGWMNAGGELDAGRVGDRLKNLRYNRASNVMERMGNRGAPAAQNGKNPIVETVEVAQSLRTAQRIEDMSNYDWPDHINLIDPAAFLAAAAVNNGNGVQPPVGFFANKIVVLGADLISIQRFEFMGRPIFHGSSNGIASQFRTDSTANFELNLPLDTVPIIFAGTCITAGVIGVTVTGFSKRIGGRRG